MSVKRPSPGRLPWSSQAPRPPQGADPSFFRNRLASKAGRRERRFLGFAAQGKWGVKAPTELLSPPPFFFVVPALGPWPQRGREPAPRTAAGACGRPEDRAPRPPPARLQARARAPLPPAGARDLQALGSRQQPLLQHLREEPKFQFGIFL